MNLIVSHINMEMINSGLKMLTLPTKLLQHPQSILINIYEQKVVNVNNPTKNKSCLNKKRKPTKISNYS